MGREVLTKRVVCEVEGAPPMGVFVARSKEDSEKPGLLLLQEAFGVNAHIRDVARRFAAEGYVVYAPELYHRAAPGFQGRYDDFGPAIEQMRQLTTEGLQADIRAAHASLSRAPGVDPERLHCVGFCLGGRAAFLAAATVPLRAAVSFYGGKIDALLDHAPRVSAPLLLLWGGKDEGIPPEQKAAVAGALTRHGKDFVSAEWSYAGHGFHCDARASYHPGAAAQAWALTLRFLSAPR